MADANSPLVKPTSNFSHSRQPPPRSTIWRVAHVLIKASPAKRKPFQFSTPTRATIPSAPCPRMDPTAPERVDKTALPLALVSRTAAITTRAAAITSVASVAVEVASTARAAG